MTIRNYLAQVAGSGMSADPFRPVVADVLPGLSWSATDGRTDPTTATGRMFVRADVTDAEHATLLAATGVTYAPFEDTSGVVLPSTATLGQVDPMKLSNIQSALEARGVPTQGLTAAHTVHELLMRCRRRFVLRQILGANDFPLTLDALVSSIPAAQRQAIAAALQARGFDTSVIAGTDTIREALRKLAMQAIALFGGVAAP